MYFSFYLSYVVLCVIKLVVTEEAEKNGTSETRKLKNITTSDNLKITYIKNLSAVQHCQHALN